jgi:hypothetical protein
MPASSRKSAPRPAESKKTSTAKVNKTAQKKIGASVKKSVLKMTGKTTHVMAHTRSANQRQQARRDAKRK